MNTDTPAHGGSRDRPHGPRRSRRITVSYTDDEFGSLLAAAQTAGLTPTGYVADAALATARGDAPPDTSPWRLAMCELMEARLQVRRVGVNINQAARILNATGEPPIWLERVASSADEAVTRLDEASSVLIDATRLEQMARRRRGREGRRLSADETRA